MCRLNLVAHLGLALQEAQLGRTEIPQHLLSQRLLTHPLLLLCLLLTQSLASLSFRLLLLQRHLVLPQPLYELRLQSPAASFNSRPAWWTAEICEPPAMSAQSTSECQLVIPPLLSCPEGSVSPPVCMLTSRF